MRVITVSSSTHALPPSGIRFNTPESFNIPLDGMTEHLAQLGIKGTAEMASNLVRYGLSKLANLLFAKQLQNIFDAEGINAISISLHPGGVKTGNVQPSHSSSIQATNGTDQMDRSSSSGRIISRGWMRRCLL